jgi:hypothetical protein
MTTQELRRGNLVFEDVLKESFVTEIEEDMVWVLSNECDSVYHIDIENINPIPLTEEWLLKFGFEKLEHIQLGTIYLNKWLRVTPYLFAQWRGASIGKIEFVHKLQNVWFSLTSEELTINQ